MLFGANGLRSVCRSRLLADSLHAVRSERTPIAGIAANRAFDPAEIRILVGFVLGASGIGTALTAIEPFEEIDQPTDYRLQERLAGLS
jgi:hypothetical protein